MKKPNHNQAGFSPVETLLVLVVVAAVGFTGWYVLHSKQTADKNLAPVAGSSQSGTGSNKTTAASDTSNQGLQSDLNGVNSANSQTTQDLNTSNSALKDSSTFTSTP